MADHPLDRPVWSALASGWAPFALGDSRAKRLAAEFGPFGAAADPNDSDALNALNWGEAGVWIVEAGETRPPSGAVIDLAAPCWQMLADDIAETPAAFEMIDLAEADAAEMLALALLTRPGPFAKSTHRLGRFVGVKAHGRLIAMAGERMRPTGFTEVSGVCTHPEHRGKGYAAGLMRRVARRILDRGETPFLHSWATNTGAITLYETLGFHKRIIVTATVLKRSA